MSELRVLIVANSEEAKRIGHALDRAGFVPAAPPCEDVAAAVGSLERTFCDAVLVALPGADAVVADAVRCLQAASPDSAIVVVGAHDERFRSELLGGGAADCIDPDEVETRILRRVLHNAASRKRLERDMRRHGAQLRALFDLNPHPMWLYDAVTLKFLAVNKVAIRSYGYSEAEFLSMSIADVRSRDDALRLRSCTEPGPPAQPSEGIRRHRTKNGSEIEVEVSVQAAPPWGANAWLEQARNVTAERRAIRAIEANERRFRELFEHSTGYICTHDLDGVLLSINPAAAASLGRGVGDLLGARLQDLVEPRQRPALEEYLRRVVRQGEDAGFMRVRRSDGGERIWQYRNRLIAEAGGPSYVMGYAQDITALQVAERERERSERRLRTIADALPLQIVYFDAKEHVVFANDAYQRARPRSGITGRHLREVLGEERYQRRRAFVERALRGEHVVFEYEEGEGEDARSMEATLIPERSETEEGVLGVHAMLQDVTAKKREQRRLLHLARVDPLTGLLNRAGFHERLDNALARARDQDSLLALLYLDVDHFKSVNDTHGHAAGDALLRVFAERLGSKLRASDVVARLGGDEFTVLIEAAPHARHVERIAGKLVAAMRRPFELHGEGLVVSVGASVGICLCLGGALSAQEMLVRADTMLYAAKQAGRGTFRMTAVEPAGASTATASAGSGRGAS